MFFIDFIAGICISVLAGIGIGGGGFLVIYLTMVKNFSQIESQGINLLFFVIAGFASLLIHIKKRKLERKSILIMIMFGTAGAVAGSLIVSFTDAVIIKKIFGGFLLISGLTELFLKTDKTEKKVDMQK